MYNDRSKEIDHNRHCEMTCVDLFAGAGGFSLAAKNAGFNVVAAVELNKNACLTYRINLADKFGTDLYESDILKLSPKKVVERNFPNGRECDVLLGGPPCQGFSVHRINNAGVSDPRNKLILRYFKFVATLRPKVFLMENVPGLLWERHKSFLDAFYRAGKKSGYRVMDPVVIDARDYGLPQRRKRVFILGVRPDVELDVEWPPAPTHGSETNRLRNPDLKSWQPSSLVFDRPILSGDENDIHMHHSEALVEVFKSTPLNGGSRHESKRTLPCHAEHNGHTDVYGRIDPTVPAPTMTTACINPSKGRFVHPTEHHGITARQAARFQTFPDWFVFKGGLMSIGEQIGNAVPVELGEKLLNPIRDALNNSKTNILGIRGRK
ncbi:DNA cytosine methyltransferase [Burkholderia metallica]|uniref:DNA cytosine methyltransferase n=1 Tax=Burkholderia metallica TaxID=488729 RepID=UPI001F330DC8|nr:DNA cytosine methyltransferase [Burkholderia metallica]